jgi:hypothetical protein
MSIFAHKPNCKLKKQAGLEISLSLDISHPIKKEVYYCD